MIRTDETSARGYASQRWSVDPFPLACPQCSVGDGWPFRATTVVNGGVRLDLHCKSCGHQWDQGMTDHGKLIGTATPEEAGQIVVRPKPDRRQTKR